MSSFKHRASVFATVVVFVLLLCVNAYSAAAEKNGIYGAWECIAETDDAEDFVYFLYFAEPCDVTFAVGWYQSEIASTYTGQFTIEGGNVLKLEMTDIESADTIGGTYSFDISDDILLLTKQSGDSLSYLFEAGEPMVFTST